jgi:hypothetical protein
MQSFLTGTLSNRQGWEDKQMEALDEENVSDTRKAWMEEKIKTPPKAKKDDVEEPVDQSFHGQEEDSEEDSDDDWI